MCTIAFSLCVSPSFFIERNFMGKKTMLAQVRLSRLTVTTNSRASMMVCTSLFAANNYDYLCNEKTIMQKKYSTKKPLPNFVHRKKLKHTHTHTYSADITSEFLFAASAKCIIKLKCLPTVCNMRMHRSNTAQHNTETQMSKKPQSPNNGKTCTIRSLAAQNAIDFFLSFQLFFYSLEWCANR